MRMPSGRFNAAHRLVPALAALIAATTALARPDLLVSSRFGNSVLRYDGATGAPLGQFNLGVGLSDPTGIALAPGGHIFVGNFNTNSVIEYAADGTVVRSLGAGTTLAGPLAVSFGPSGDLFVSGGVSNAVYEFAPSTGSLIRTFTGGGLSGPSGVAFAPDGSVLVSSSGTNQILRYDQNTGAFLAPFGSGVTLSNPVDLVVGPDGGLYTSSVLNNRIVRYDFATGQGQVFATAGLSRPIGLAFDSLGDLIVANQLANNVLRFAPDGTPLGVLIAPGGGGINGPNFLAFVPAPYSGLPMLLLLAMRPRGRTR